eukprot:7042043-Pyramimonas_sp.AAC.1
MELRGRLHAMRQLRRGGPSHDGLRNYRTSLDVGRRGRWAPQSRMVCRYEARTKVQREENHMNAEQKRECSFAIKTLLDEVQSS